MLYAIGPLSHTKIFEIPLERRSNTLEVVNAKLASEASWVNSMVMTVAMLTARRCKVA